MGDLVDYGSMAGIAGAITTLTEAIRYAAGKAAAASEEQTRAVREQEQAKREQEQLVALNELRIANVRMEAELRGVSSGLLKMEARVEEQNAQVRQGLDEAIAKLHALALEAARTGG